MRRSAQGLAGKVADALKYKIASDGGSVCQNQLQNIARNSNPLPNLSTSQLYARAFHKSAMLSEAGAPVGRKLSLPGVASAPLTGLGKASSLLPANARQLIDKVKQPGSLRKAISLQLEAAWQRHHRKVLVGGLFVITWAAWRSLRFTAEAFVGISESLATTGIVSLGAALAMATTAWLYRRHFMMTPSSVYRMAMLRLNTHSGVLEIMGAPVLGSDVRASVLTGGGLTFKGLRPKFRSRRVQMIFPLRGTERRGLVSVEAKKRHGELKMSLLAVDVPLPQALGGEQRVYVEGGPKSYARGGVLDELRRPFLAAITSQEAAEAEDEAEEATEERRARIEATIAAPVEGGLYWHEKAFLAAKKAAQRWSARVKKSPEHDQFHQAPPPGPL